MTNAELAVLSLVVECPRHAYEVERTVAERGMRDWTDVGFSSIYYLLRKMERAGLVEGRGDSRKGRGPARVIYAPTSAGMAAWQEASLGALATPEAKTPFLLGLSNLGGLPPERALEAARHTAAILALRLQDVRGKRQQAGEVEWFVAETFDYSERTLACASEWVAGLVERLETRMGASEMAGKMKPFEPRITRMPDRLMAVVRTVGDPSEAAGEAFPALYGAVYPLKFALKKQGVEYRIEPPRARWFGGPDWVEQPRDEWRAEWAIPIPDGTVELAQKVPGVAVEAAMWEYGTVAEVLYIGAYSEETPTIEALHAFIEAEGHEIAGPHEEEYVSRPDAKEPKTVIRYQVRPR